MSKGMIISGFAGIGKTTIAQKYPNRVIDLESSDFKWIYGNEQTANMSKEIRKGVKDKQQDPNWPYNYIEAIRQASKKYDVVLISQQADLRQILDQENIKYILCFPDTDCKAEYIERYTKRGNQSMFVKLIESNFENWIEDLKKAPQEKLILSVGKHLEDALRQKLIF